MAKKRAPRLIRVNSLAVAAAVFVVAAGCTVNSAQKRYILAEKLWTNSKYIEAVAEFEQIVKMDPVGEIGKKALFRAAMTQTLFLGEHLRAVEKFNNYIAVVGGSDVTIWAARKEIGEIYYAKLKLYREAIKHYRALLEEHSNSEDAPMFLYRAGKSHFYLWEFPQAIQVFEEVLNKYGGTPWAEKAEYEIGLSYYTGGSRDSEEQKDQLDFKKAMGIFEGFIKAHPNSPLKAEAEFGIGSCLEELDQLEAALQKYESIKTAYPSPNVVEIKILRIKERLASRK